MTQAGVSADSNPPFFGDQRVARSLPRPIVPQVLTRRRDGLGGRPLRDRERKLVANPAPTCGRLPERNRCSRPSPPGSPPA
jgi:hypothetical protein